MDKLQSSTLSPPNARWMSDVVITDVKQRISAPRIQFLSGPKRTTRSAKKNSSIREQVLSSTRDSPSEIERELRRQRNRTHQARHKAKQKKRLADLESGVIELRDEVQQLVKRHQTLCASVPVDTTVWKVMAEYCRLFQYGYRPSVSAWEVTGLPSARCRFDASLQREFVHATMMPDMTYNTMGGLEMMLQDWQHVTTCHDDVNVHLIRLEQGPDGSSFIATMNGTLTMTEVSLRMAFPHLVTGDDPSEWSPLARRLLGQKIFSCGSIRVVWDDRKNRIVDFHAGTDMVTPFLKLLGSLEAVSQLFDNALMRPEYASM